VRLRDHVAVAFEAGSAAMLCRILGFAVALACILFAGAVFGQNGTMKSTAPEMMTPPGQGDAMRECNKMAMDQHIKMEDRARFVQDCIAKKMK
jgi:hypothetical protein